MTGGIATFLDLADDMAETISLKFAAGSTSAVSNAITVAAGQAIQLFVTVQPPSRSAAGQPFSLTVTADDDFKNVNATYNGGVTISLAGDPEFHHDREAKERRGDIQRADGRGGRLRRGDRGRAGRLAGTSTDPLSVTSWHASAAPAPAATPAARIRAGAVVVLERLATTQKTKKGKPVGKPVFSGFYIQYSER